MATLHKLCLGTSNPDHLRLFIAIQVPPNVKGALERLHTQLGNTVAKSSIRWTTSDQMHVTLRFLGNVETGRVESLVGALRLGCRKFEPFSLSAERVGFFPNARRPRVIWAGVNDKTGQLALLQQAIDVATREFTDEPAEKEFVGHLTLARIKVIDRHEAQALGREATAIANICFGTWIADAVELIRSQLSPSGAKYSTIARLELLGGPQHNG